MTRKTADELGEELCEYCELSDKERGVRNYGNGPIYCSDSICCDRAYQSYLNTEEEE